MEEDKRPDPKPRKHLLLWQTYLLHNELVEMRKRRVLRISSIEAGKSNMDIEFERYWLETLQLDAMIEKAKQMMIVEGQIVGPIWDWTLQIRGLGSGSLNAQLLAQFDDVGKFATVSKFWRFSGWAVIDGKRERGQKGQTSKYNRRLKSICYLVGDQFIKQQTPRYVDLYYAEKDRLRELHPEPVEIPDPPKGTWKFQFSDSHIHRMARRKMVKIFLQHLWVRWREFEGLPVSEPWIIAQGGHANYIPPFH